MMLTAGIVCSATVNAQSTLPVQAPANAEGIIRCGQVQYENYLRTQDPMYDVKKEEVMRIVAAKEKKVEAKTNGTPQPAAQYTIPIVVHVVWNTSAQNVTDAKINSMIAQMNMDWARTNTDAGNTPSVWQPPVAANMEIQFCLATTDPSGNPTNGISRKNTSTTSFSTNDNMKQNATGGDAPWNVNNYLNIWICNLSGRILGFANFPPISTYYGTVVHYITVGSLTNPAGGSFGYGRTLSHEIGHNFTLNHIWDGGCPAVEMV